MADSRRGESLRATYESLPQELRDQILAHLMPTEIHVLATCSKGKRRRLDTLSRRTFSSLRYKMVLDSRLRQEKLRTIGRLAQTSRTVLHDIVQMRKDAANLLTVVVDLRGQSDTDEFDPDGEARVIPDWLIHHMRRVLVTHVFGFETWPIFAHWRQHEERLDATLEKGGNGRWALTSRRWTILNNPQMEPVRNVLAARLRRDIEREIQTELVEVVAQPQASARELWLLQHAVAVWPDGRTKRDHTTGDEIRITRSYYSTSKSTLARTGIRTTCMSTLKTIMIYFMASVVFLIVTWAKATALDHQVIIHDAGTPTFEQRLESMLSRPGEIFLSDLEAHEHGIWVDGDGSGRHCVKLLDGTFRETWIVHEESSRKEQRSTSAEPEERSNILFDDCGMMDGYIHRREDHGAGREALSMTAAPADDSAGKIAQSFSG